MKNDLQTVTQWLLAASQEVGREYFQLPIAGRYERGYRERVYCYELYHRWRQKWEENCRFSLSGEVDKANHPVIRDGSKPDFLVHLPGEMINLLIVEVKPGTSRVSEMVKDLVKLTRFRKDLKDANGSPGNYYAAYFWVYGVSEQKWSKTWNSIVIKCKSRQDIDLGKIKVYLHSVAGKSAVDVT